MKKRIAVILAPILFCACGSQPQNRPDRLEMSDVGVIKIEPDTPHLIRVDQAKLLNTAEMLDMIDSIDYIKLDSSEPMGRLTK